MNSKKEVQHVYLVGAKSLGAYGGYETFVYKLTEYHQNKENIKYHVACKANGDGCMDESKFEGVTKINDHEFEFHNAHCFKIDVPQIGSAQAIYYDVAALKACCEHIKKNHIPHPIVYIMACRIGPFAGHFYREIHKLGGTVFLNPDGECEIISIFEQYKPEIVVNLGAQAGVRYSITNPDAYVEANLIGFYNILEACRHSYDEGHTPVEHLVYGQLRARKVYSWLLDMGGELW